MRRSIDESSPSAAGPSKRLLPAAALAVCLLGCSGEAPVAPRPNVVLVVVDALRADHLSDFGYPRDTAPGLARLRSVSTRFLDAWAAAPWTAPSTASLFTGLVPPRHGVNPHGAVLPEEALTLAEVLKANGYVTHGLSFNPHVSAESGFAQGFDRLSATERVLLYPDVQRMLDETVAWLDAAPAEPFFLYLHPMNVHGPYRVPEAHQEVLLGRRPSREFAYYGRVMKAIMNRGEVARRGEVTPPMLASLTEQYDTAIRYSTDQIGRLLELLDARGLFDDALVIVTSDHGEELFEHGGFSHGFTLYREMLHIPLYIKLPRQREGREVRAPVSNVDVFATVLDALGLLTPTSVDGRSLLPLLAGEPVDWTQRPLLQQTGWDRRAVGRSLLLHPYHLIELEKSYDDPSPRSLLFHVTDDPQEATDLTEREPEVAERLRAALDALEREYAERAIAPGGNALGELDQDRLRALGYLE
jgi:arylsulfatase A-like enzyme